MTPNDPAARDDARLRATVLVTAAELAAALDDPRLVVLAVGNAEYGMPPGPPFIPGAVPVDMPRDFAGAPGGTRGNRPLPEIAELQAKARSWGLRADSRVVLYDSDRLLQAARGWWTLRWAGMAEVRLLDGGLAAWRAAGLPLADTPGARPPGDVTLSPGHMPTLDADAAADWARDRLLLDTRVRVNYVGGTPRPGEAPRGHIPGAVSSPAHDALTEPGPFAPPETLRLHFDAIGALDPGRVAVTCGAGVSAAHTAAALATLGVAAPMYVGSWSAWAADPARPAVIGGRPYG